MTLAEFVWTVVGVALLLRWVREWAGQRRARSSPTRTHELTLAQLLPDWRGRMVLHVREDARWRRARESDFEAMSAVDPAAIPGLRRQGKVRSIR